MSWGERKAVGREEKAEGGVVVDRAVITVQITTNEEK